MPVPNSPTTYRRIIPVELAEDVEDGLDINVSKPPRPVYTTNFYQGRYTVGVEAFLNTDLGPRRKTSCPAFGLSGGVHRSRDRTRQSAVQRLVERKLAQKEKEREKERDRSLGTKFDSFSSRQQQSFRSFSPTRQRDTSGSRSENGFILGAGRCSSPSKENLEPDFFGSFRRSARSVSGTRFRGANEEPVAKTYITIGPGKPTRIREHSPAKSAKLSSEETVTSARERFAQSRSGSPLRHCDTNRPSSPSPHRKTSRTVSPSRSKEILRDASPLKSTDILKTFRASRSESNFSKLPDENQNTEPYYSEKIFKVNEDQLSKPSRRLSVDILKSIHSPVLNDKRASPESDASSSSFSSFSGSTDSVESTGKPPSVLSQRRISLEQRFRARTSTTRLGSPDRSSVHSFSQTSGIEASAAVDETWTHIKIRRYSTVKTHCEFSSVSGGSVGGGGFGGDRPVPASRKISLPQEVGRRPEPAPRRRSLTTILSAERFSPDKENSEYSSISINRINRNSKWTELAGDDGQRSYFSLSPKSRGSPQFGDEYSLFRSRSTSLSSTGSVRSTGTMCESESSEQGRSLRSTEPPSRVLSPLQCTRNLRVPDNCDEIKKWKVEVNLATAAELSSLSSIRTVHQPNPSTREQRRLRRKTTNDEPMPRQGSTNVRLVRKNSGRMGGLPVNADIEDDVQSVSTVSGSGIDFFRKFVQRKTSATEGVESCRECQDQFRREVLIDRLVSDSLSTRARLSVKSNKGGADSLPAVLEDRLSSDPGLHRCVLHQEDQEDSRSVSTKSSVSRVSSVSGTGLLFLKNYLKKKKSKSRSSTSHGTKDVSNMSFFNSTPLPFPPQGGFYGPAFVQEPSDDGGCHSRRHSLCSTVADLLNEDFDCDDSELKNLDWEEWDEPLPEDLTYDDLVSVISESFYSEELDFSELCDLDLEGRKTVVANDKEISSPSIVNSDNTVSPDDARRRSPNPAPEPEKALSSEPRSKYGSYKSNSFLLDLEAELELPPMTPVSDEKEEAVRAISRTISKYMRTRSDGSYEGGVTRSDGSYEGGATKSDGSYEGGVPSRQSYYSRTNTNRSYDGADPRTTYRLSGSMSRQSVCVSRQEDYGRVSRNSGYEGSRLSMVSPAKSDCIPELSAAEPSSRRPLSQLLIYDAATISPTGRLSPEEQRLHNYGNQSYPLLGGVRGPRSPPAPLIQQKISEILSLPKNEYSRSFEDKSGDMRQTDPSVLNYHETRLRNNDNKTKTANRDSLLCGASNNLSPTCSPPPAVVRPTFFRHSSTNSSDSGCPLFEDKVPSLSPTPSPRTNIELLSSNRTKLANFWERSLGTSQSSEVSTWVPGSSGRQGFQPVKSTFCSEASLGNSQDRLAHFLDVTRRAAEGRRNGRGYFHRASTGSDCSDFFERIPPSPSLNRRRDSFTEHFV